MDGEFEAACARLRNEHAQQVEVLRAGREAAVASQKTLHEALAEAHAEAEEELVAATMQQEAGLEEERVGLEARAGAAQELLAAARQEMVTAKEECGDLQRVLDEMSRGLQERRRRGHALSADADHAHNRKLKAEAEMRDLRRQKTTIERVLGSAGNTPHTERAIAGLSEDVRTAQGRLEALRNELARTQRLKQERRKATVGSEELAEQLERELVEERRRSDELQRVLLRLEHDG